MIYNEGRIGMPIQYQSPGSYGEVVRGVIYAIDATNHFLVQVWAIKSFSPLDGVSYWRRVPDEQTMICDPSLCTNKT